MTDEATFEIPVGDGVLVAHRGGEGPLALVLHGGPGLPDYVGGCADELAGAMTTVWYAQRGCPPSTVGGPYPVEAHVEDVVAVIDALGAERAWVVGHSWGGHLALHVAVAHPERLHGIVCVGTLGASNDVLEEFEARLLAPLTEEQRARHAELEARSEAGETTHEERLESLRLIWPGYFARPEEAPPCSIERFGESAETFASVMAHFERGTLERGLPETAVPTLFVHGRQDPLPARGAVATAALMPNAQVELLDDCGHLPWLEQPGELVRAVAAFVGATAVA